MLRVHGRASRLRGLQAAPEELCKRRPPRARRSLGAHRVHGAREILGARFSRARHEMGRDQ